MRYDIRAKVRTYKDTKTGDDKNVYATIGSAWIGDKNSIQLDMIPLNWDGKCFLNEPYDKQEKSSDNIPNDVDENLKEQLKNIPF